MSEKTRAFSSTGGNSKPEKVAIVGSTGKLGRRAMNQLLDRKIPVKCLIRQSTPPDFLLEQQKSHPDLVEFVTGDVTNPKSVQELLKDCTHCLALHGATRMSKWYEIPFAADGSEADPSHAKQVNYKSMETFVQCAKTTNCRHIVRITGKGETPWSFFSVLINGLGSMAKGWNYEGEQVLRQQQPITKSEQHLDYTIIRPGVMKEDFDYQKEGVHLELADNGGDLPVSAVSYDQIAELCVEALFHPQARDTTLTAMNVANTESSDKATLSIAERLEKVQKDSRLFPSSLIQEHKRAVKTVFRSLAAGLLAVMAGLVFKFLR